MEKLFLELRKKIQGDENFSELNCFKGKTISIAGTVQYLDFIPIIKKYLEKNNKILIKKGAFHQGHVIGCNPSAFDTRAEILLLLTDGKFHAINNALLLDREIYIYNLNKLEKICKQDLQKQKQRVKAKKVKFLSSQVVGLIVSTKQGQNFKGIKNLSKRIIKKFLFLKLTI